MHSLIDLTVDTLHQTVGLADDELSRGQGGKGPKPSPNWLVSHYS
ncbi:hypothetical protein SA496_15260 [Pseudomonas sp. JS3066]|nr:hypothetical protein [Pseudomonas sp. JS3066]WVK96423.1 hypothetical protein SA496_15260 [Pseudomonas sp. JS3066]